MSLQRQSAQTVELHIPLGPGGRGQGTGQEPQDCGPDGLSTHMNRGQLVQSVPGKIGAFWFGSVSFYMRGGWGGAWANDDPFGPNPV